MRYTAVTGLMCSIPVSLAALDDLGVQSATLSFELSAKKISGLSGELKRGIIGYGYLPLMRFRNCPARGQKGCFGCDGQRSLTDRRGIDFPLLCSGRRYSTLLNSRPLVLSDKSISGIDFMTLYFTAELGRKANKFLTHIKNLPSFPVKRPADFISGSCYDEKDRASGSGRRYGNT